jgi:hypothetical protein
LTVPLPVPLLPPVTLIHDALLVAAQLQPAGAVTCTLPDPPPDATERLAGESEYVQIVAPASLIVWVCPPTLMVPVRDAVLVLGATE